MPKYQDLSPIQVRGRRLVRMFVGNVLVKMHPLRPWTKIKCAEELSLSKNEEEHDF